MPWNLTLGLQQNTIQGRPYCSRCSCWHRFVSSPNKKTPWVLLQRSPWYTSHDMTIDHSSSRWRVEFQMLPSFLHVATSSICWLHWWFRCLAPMMNLDPLMVKWDFKPTQTNQHITKLLLVDINIYQPVYKPYIEIYQWTLQCNIKTAIKCNNSVYLWKLSLTQPSISDWKKWSFESQNFKLYRSRWLEQLTPWVKDIL